MFRFPSAPFLPDRAGRWAGLLLLGLLLLVGCARTPGLLGEESAEPAFRRGKSLLREGRHAEALNAFLRVLENRPHAPESHLEAGHLYLDHLKDPIEAIHHFRRYLEQQPDSEKAPFVRQLIETAQKQFAMNLPGQPYVEETDRLELLARLEQLTKENDQLKRQLAQLGSPVPPAPAAAPVTPRPGGGVNATATVAAGGRPPLPGAPAVGAPSTAPPPGATGTPTSYTVQGGDTLMKISAKVYGSSGRWQEIYQANRDQLANPHSLKVGQVLKIP